jgi:Heme/copper-type cytochrome/quinol oxidases, subunit 2
MRGRLTGRIEGLLLGLALVALVVIAVVTVGGRFWWLPPLASQHGKEIDTLFTVTLIVTGIVFVLVQSLLAFLVFKFAGSEKRRAIHFTENRTLELVWTIVPAVILTMLIFFGGRLWSRIQLTEPPEDAFEVEVWGEQFRWTFRYPGKDGKFGRTDLKLVSVENPLGIDKNDPASKDDIFFFAGEENCTFPSTNLWSSTCAQRMSFTVSMSLTFGSNKMQSQGWSRGHGSSRQRKVSLSLLVPNFAVWDTT